MEQSRISRRAPIIAIILALAAITGLVLFALSNQPKETIGRATTSEEAAPNPSERMSIMFTDNGFEPSEITAIKGTAITVTNRSSRTVQFSSDNHPSHQENTEMNLKVLAPGESASYIASKVGTWGYHDHLNESKTGTVTVTE